MVYSVSDGQLPMGGKWGKYGVFIPSHSHQAVPIPILIPIRIKQT